MDEVYAKDVLAECDRSASSFADRDPLAPIHLGLLIAALLAAVPEDQLLVIDRDGIVHGLALDWVTDKRTNSDTASYRLVPPP